MFYSHELCNVYGLCDFTTLCTNPLDKTRTMYIAIPSCEHLQSFLYQTTRIYHINPTYTFLFKPLRTAFLYAVSIYLLHHSIQLSKKKAFVLFRNNNYYFIIT